MPVRAGWTHRHKRLWRGGLVAANIAVLAVIVTLVLANQHTTINSNAAPVSDSSVAKTVANPLDQLSSADIAQTVAQVNSLPETTAITNQAQSQAANIAIAAANNNVISKPQVVTAGLKSRADIQTYITVAGDTVSGLAKKFGVTSDSIRWSNNLTAADALKPGTSLLIPPVNGIVYVVKPGDTPATLAIKFQSNADQIIAYNDAEIGGLTTGERIIIPNASEVGAAAGIAGVVGATSGSFPWGAGPIYGSNGYDFGNCTWYVASQIAVPANWGNADTWAYYARLSGWGVSSAPTAGAIAQTSAGYFGHVAIVQSVNGNGTVTISEMNHDGFDVVDKRTVPASEFQNYITH